MKKFFAGVAVAVVAFTSGSSFAGIYLEPGLGYLTGKVESGSTSNDASGTGYYAKVGYSMLGLGVGLDYQGGDLTIKTTGADSKSKSTDIGLFVQYKLPILFKFSATYYFQSESKYTDASNSESTLKGTAMKLGVGYTGLPFIALNFDYYTPTYTKAEIGGLSGDLDPKLIGKIYMISVSMPFDI